MKEFDKQTWLGELANKCEVPAQQVMVAWATYKISCDLIGVMECKLEFSGVVLSRLFED